MYLEVIKKVMQGLWALGLAGSLYLSTTQPETLPQYVIEHPSAVWLVGPLFASFTALCFKEGACYGKLESGGLFFLVPATLLSHMAGAPAAVKIPMLVSDAVLVAVLAARKYSQAVKDDVGDKTVFQYLALSTAEQEAWDRRVDLGEEDKL